MLSKEAQIFVDSVMEDAKSELQYDAFQMELEIRIEAFERELLEHAKSEIISAVKRVEL